MKTAVEQHVTENLAAFGYYWLSEEDIRLAADCIAFVRGFSEFLDTPESLHGEHHEAWEGGADALRVRIEEASNE